MIKGEQEDMESKREEEIIAKVVVDEFPEGGLRAWLALAGSTLVLTCTFSISNSFGTFLNYYKQVSILFLSSSQSLTYDFLTFIDTYSTNSLRTIPQRLVGLDRLTSLSRLVQLSSQAFSSIKDSKSPNSLSNSPRILRSPKISPYSFRYQSAFGSIFWIIGMSCLSICESFIEIFLCHSLCMGASPLVSLQSDSRLTSYGLTDRTRRHVLSLPFGSRHILPKETSFRR